MNLLFVANFGSDVGYAWHTIDAVYRRVGAALRRDGVSCFIGYPAVPPAGTSSVGATPLVFDYASTRTSLRALVAFLRLLRDHRIETLYFTDRTRFSWRYLLFRLAGVRRIVVHDRTSGERNARFGAFRLLKRFMHSLPGIAADCYIGVSDFVARRLVRTGVPPDRVHRVYNGIEVARFAGGPDGFLQDELRLPRDTRVVFASGRAQPYKGIEVLVDAAAQLEAQGIANIAFVFCGDGPSLAGLQARVAARGLRTFHFLGRRDDVPRLLRSATVAVVPSLWAEAFGLTVVEAMAAGVPVVATRVGGIPELVEEGRTALLVEPGDATAIAGAVRRLLEAPALRASMAQLALAEATRRFSVERTVSELYDLLIRLLNPVTAPPSPRSRPDS